MKRWVIGFIKCLLLPVGMLYGLGSRRPRIPILMYHRINDGVDKELSVKPSDFLWQMDYLRRKGYRVLSLEEALAGAVEGCATDGKCVVITFDDGYEDFLTHAYPVLRQHGYPAIVYIVPGYIDTGNTFWWDGDIGESRLLSWAQIDQLSADGLVQFGSHTMSHRDLDTLEEKEIFEEMRESRRTIEERLQREVKHFAYPRGIVTARAQQAAACCYDTAVSIFEGVRLCAEGPHHKLGRVPVQRSDGRLLFGPRLRGWLVAEGWLKALMGRH